MPLLTQLRNNVLAAVFYKDRAPDGAREQSLVLALDTQNLVKHDTTLGSPIVPPVPKRFPAGQGCRKGRNRGQGCRKERDPASAFTARASPVQKRSRPFGRLL